MTSPVGAPLAGLQRKSRLCRDFPPAPIEDSTDKKSLGLLVNWRLPLPEVLRRWQSLEGPGERVTTLEFNPQGRSASGASAARPARAPRRLVIPSLLTHDPKTPFH